MRTRQCVPGSDQPSTYPAVTNPQRTLQCPGAYPAVIKPLGAYLAVRTLQCPGAYPAVTKPWPGLGLERSVPGSPHSALRTLQCQACSLKTGFPASTPRPRSRRPFSQAKSHIRQAIHGFLGPLVGCARAGVVGAYPAANGYDMEKKKSPPPRRRQPPPPRPSPPLGTPPFGGREARRPPAERKRGGYPSSPGTFADAQTRRPPPPRPSSPRSPASPEIPLLGPPRRRAQVGNLGEEGLTLSRS